MSISDPCWQYLRGYFVIKKKGILVLLEKVPSGRALGLGRPTSCISSNEKATLWTCTVEALAYNRIELNTINSPSGQCPWVSDGNCEAAQRNRPADPSWCTDKHRPWSPCSGRAPQSSACSDVCSQTWPTTAKPHLKWII